MPHSPGQTKQSDEWHNQRVKRKPTVNDRDLRLIWIKVDDRLVTNIKTWVFMNNAPIPSVEWAVEGEAISFIGHRIYGVSERIKPCSVATNVS